MDENDIRSVLGLNIKRLRAQQGLSQLALALETGLAHNFICDIENGKKWVSPDTLSKLTAALNCELFQLFLSEPQRENETSVYIDSYIDELSRSVLKAVAETKDRYTKG
jgi:transcriptional regulator with XRE-family HTH domain